ncbi:MAG TPA: lactonase family protein, partial [Pseudoduganella sp.]
GGMTRFLRRVSATAAATMALAAMLASSRGVAAELVYVGTQASQVHALRFDAGKGTLAPLGKVAEGGAPTWLLAHPRLPVLYAADNARETDGKVTAYAVDRTSGALASLGEAPAGGSGTTYLSLDAKAGTLFAANFGSGSVASIAVNPDGSLGAPVSTVRSTGSGPHRRQASAHAHAIAVDPSGRYVLVPDLGADRVFVYGFDPASHALAPDDAAAPRSFAAPPGSGPRQLAFGNSGDVVYVLNELTADIMALRWDAGQGRLALVQTVALSGAGFTGTKSGAAIAMSADGRFVYATNRGEHALQVYRVAAGTGELAFVQRIASGGEVPWAFALHPSGKWLIVANQRSGKVTLFDVDTASGMLAETGQSVDVPSPVGVAFVR